MNKEEFQKNRQILKMLSTDMFNQMHNMYDQLAVAENRIENARKEGYEEGYQARCAENEKLKAELREARLAVEHYRHVAVVGHCEECDYHYPPLTAVVDGEIKEVSPMRCSRMFAFVEPYGWCYKFCKDGKSYFSMT